MKYITRLSIGVLIITTILGLATLSIIAHAYTYQVFQPTNPSISSSNTQGYLAQLSQCSISSNPYGGATGTYGMLNCVAIDYGAISVVVWFYEPSDGQGVLLGYSENQYSASSTNHAPLLYVGTNGYLYGIDGLANGGDCQCLRLRHCHQVGTWLLLRSGRQAPRDPTIWLSTWMGNSLRKAQ